MDLSCIMVFSRKYPQFFILGFPKYSLNAADLPPSLLENKF